MKTLLSLLIGLALVLAPLPVKGASPQADEPKKVEKKDKKKDKKKDQKKDLKKDPKKDKKDQGSDEPLPEPKDSERQLSRLVRDLQFALEGGSARSFLENFNSGKFDDYPRFEDMVERLMREDTIRVHFRTVFTAPPSGQGKAQMALDGDMELGRKDGAGQLTRRRQQVVVEFEYTRRCWKIINLTPRDYFQPL